MTTRDTVWTQWMNWVSKWVGDRTNSSEECNIDARFLQTFSERYPLHALLPYEAYDEKTQVFVNQKSMGFMLESTLLTGSQSEMEQILASVLTDLPTEVDLQVWLWASPKVEPIFQGFLAERAAHRSDLAWLAEERIQFLKKGVFSSLLLGDTFLVRDFRLFFAVSLPKKTSDTAGCIRQLQDIRTALQGSLKSIHLLTRTVTVEDFLSLLRDWVNLSDATEPAHGKWNPYESLHVQITDPEYRYHVLRDSIRCEDSVQQTDVVCLTVRELPDHHAQGHMRDMIGAFFNVALQISCPFWIMLSLRGLDFEKSMHRVQLKYLNRDKAVKSSLAKWHPLIAREHQDWSFVRQRLMEGDRLVHAFFQVVICDRPHIIAQSERKLRDLYRSQGWKLKKVPGVQLQLWLALFPMMITEGLWDDLSLFGFVRTLTAFNAVTFMPLQGEWKGTRRASLLLPGRRGQLAFWNPFDNTEGNYNVAIAAKSGSGKSVLTQEYIVSLVAHGGRVWVIDIGRSYEKTCRLLRGEFIEFSMDNAISLNPFSHIVHFDEALELLKPLTAAMVRPSSIVSDEEMAFLEKALKAAWLDKKQMASMSDVAHSLCSITHPVCQNLAHLLYPYTQEGMYGRYFEGVCNISLDNALVVLELEELKSKRDLQKLVLLVLMYHISQRMYLGDRMQLKSCVIDEAWDLLSGDHEGAARFIETGYRKARRYNANFVTITQSVNDYFKNATALAAYENSDNNIILSQKPESIDQLRATGRLAMNDATEKIFKSLRKTDEYSECVIKCPAGLSVHRIILDPYARILYSSKGEEFERVRHLQANGYSLHEAIRQVAGQGT